jgi:putative ABC transport system permease protein
MDNLVTANIRQRPFRSLVSVAGVALGVALVILFTGLARGMSNDLHKRSSNLRAEIIFMKPGSMELMSSVTNLSTKYADEILKVDGVEAAVPSIRYVSQGGKGFGFEQIEGVDWEPFAKMNVMRLVNGRFAQAVDEVVIDETKARQNNLTVGSVISLFGNQPYRVTGIYSPEAGPRVKMSLAAMQDALEAPGKCTWIYVKARDASQLALVAQRLNESLPGNKIQYTRDVFTSIEDSIPYLGLFLNVLVGLAAVVSGVVVMLAMYTTITERTREIGILKAMGASRGYIIGVIEKEAVLISAIGLVVGFVGALLAGFFIHRVSGLVFEYSWAWALTAGLIGLVGGAVGALYPAVRAANLDAVSALAYE